MTKLTPHPHAEILRAIADGLPAERFEYSTAAINGGLNWNTPYSERHLLRVLASLKDGQVRIKPEPPKTIKVNGFEVIAPMTEAPGEGHHVYVLAFCEQCGWASFAYDPTSRSLVTALNTNSLWATQEGIESMVCAWRGTFGVKEE